MERLKSHRDFVTVLKRRRTVIDRDIVVHILVHSGAGRTESEYVVGRHMGHADKQTASVCGTVSDPYRPVSPAGTGESSSREARRRLGLAVSKAVGNAVTRNRVKRRFRVLAQRYQDELPRYCDVVMRAKSGAADVPFSSLDSQVQRLFIRAKGIAEQPDHHTNHMVHHPAHMRDGL